MGQKRSYSKNLHCTAIVFETTILCPQAIPNGNDFLLIKAYAARHAWLRTKTTHCILRTPSAIAFDPYQKSSFYQCENIIKNGNWLKFSFRNTLYEIWPHGYGYPDHTSRNPLQPHAGLDSKDLHWSEDWVTNKRGSRRGGKSGWRLTFNIRFRGAIWYWRLAFILIWLPFMHNSNASQRSPETS